MTVVLGIALAMLGVAAALVLVRLFRGPSNLDRIIAAEILLVIVIAGVAARVRAAAHDDLPAAAACPRPRRLRRRRRRHPLHVPRRRRARGRRPRAAEPPVSRTRSATRMEREQS